MRSRKVTRWYCDHCSAARFQQPAMVRHETSCTANPARKCHICNGDPQTGAEDLPVLIAFCKESAAKSQDGLTLTPEAIDKLRELCDSCPACMLAAVRQANVYAVDWDAKLEFKSFWDHWRQEQAAELGRIIGPVYV